MQLPPLQKTPRRGETCAAQRMRYPLWEYLFTIMSQPLLVKIVSQGSRLGILENELMLLGLYLSRGIQPTHTHTHTLGISAMI